MASNCEVVTSKQMADVMDHTDAELLRLALRGGEEPFTLLYRRRQGGIT